MKKTLLALSILFPFITDAATLSISTINPNSNAPAGTEITFQITPATLLNPRYTITDDSPASTLSNSNINSLGKFDWTPTNTDIGTHNLLITGTDSYGNRDTLYQTLTIATSTPLSIQSYTPNNILPGKTFSVALIAQGYSDPSFSVSDSFTNSSISNSNINSSGILSWQPNQSDVGTHNLGLRVTTPSGRNDILYQTVTVDGIYVPTTSYTVKAGTPLSITLTPYGLTNQYNNPTYKVTDTERNNTIENASFNVNTFNWTPQNQDIGSHTVTISTNDLNGNYVSIDLYIQVTAVNTPVVTTPAPVSVTTTKATFKFTKSLNTGSTGTEVTELQKFLKSKGFYSGPVNGNFGPLTKAAVKKFQKAHGISQLGNVGPATRVELNK